MAVVGHAINIRDLLLSRSSGISHVGRQSTFDLCVLYAVAKSPYQLESRASSDVVLGAPTTPGDREAEAAVVGVGGVSGTLDLSTHCALRTGPGPGFIRIPNKK